MRLKDYLRAQGKNRRDCPLCELPQEDRYEVDEVLTATDGRGRYMGNDRVVLRWAESEGIPGVTRWKIAQHRTEHIVARED